MTSLSILNGVTIVTSVSGFIMATLKNLKETPRQKNIQILRKRRQATKATIYKIRDLLPKKYIYGTEMLTILRGTLDLLMDLKNAGITNLNNSKQWLHGEDDRKQHPCEQVHHVGKQIYDYTNCNEFTLKDGNVELFVQTEREQDKVADDKDGMSYCEESMNAERVFVNGKIYENIKQEDNDNFQESPFTEEIINNHANFTNCTLLDSDSVEFSEVGTENVIDSDCDHSHQAIMSSSNGNIIDNTTVADGETDDQNSALRDNCFGKTLGHIDQSKLMGQLNGFDEESKALDVDSANSGGTNSQRVSEDALTEDSDSDKCSTYVNKSKKQEFKTVKLKPHPLQLGKYTKATEFKCQYCEYTFVTNRSLMKHIQTHKEIDTRIYACNICSYRIDRHDSLRWHVLVHTNDRPHKCPICAFRTKRVKALTSHVLCIHKELSLPYECSTCPYRCVKESSLEKHMELHGDASNLCLEQDTDEQSLTCFICQFQATSILTYNSHMASHNESAIFKCNKPNCSFETRWYHFFKEHSSIHVNYISYKCCVCDKEYKQRNELARHMIQHLDKTEVEECFFSFISNARQSNGNIAKVDDNIDDKDSQNSDNASSGSDTEIDETANKDNITLRIVKNKNSVEIKVESDVEVRAENSDEGVTVLPKEQTANKAGLETLVPRDNKMLPGRNMPRWVKSCECDICGQTFRTHSHCTEHKLMHKEQKNYKCSSCPLSFQYSASLRQHQRRKHKDEVFQHKCGACEEKFRDIAALSEHQIEHFNVAKPYKCYICKKAIETISLLYFHMDEHFNNKCNKCGKAFAKTSWLEQHIKKDHAHNETVSSILQESNKSETDDVSVFELPIERPAEVNEFTETSEQQSQIPQKNKDTSNTVHNITETVKAKPSLNKQPAKRLRVDPTTKRKYECLLCGQILESYTTFRRHAKRHNKLMHACKQCDFTAMEYRVMKRHRIHNHSARAKCTVCEKELLTERNLEIHMLIHKNEKPFVCTHCGFRARQTSILAKHMLRHKSERPYMCSKCGKLFRMKSPLIRHLTTHESDRPFQCSYCHMTFKDITALRRHETTHNKTLQCTTCGKFFGSQRQLRKHHATHEKKSKHAGSLNTTCIQ